MSINSVEHINAASSVYSANSASATAAAETSAEEKAAQVDKIEISDEGRKKSNKLSSEQIDSLWKQQEQQLEKFKLMLNRMLGKQANNSNLATTSTSDVQSNALASISEGGEYSVDAVAGRIMNMATALANGDDSKLQVLKDAVIEGFRQVAGMFGGDKDGDNWLSALPQVSQDTYTEIMSRFDAWEDKANQSSVSQVIAGE